MKWVWTWGGKCFGYIDRENLWTHNGKHVGKLDGNEIYGADGRYIGELKSENRLLTEMGKKSWRKSAFSPYAQRVGTVIGDCENRQAYSHNRQDELSLGFGRNQYGFWLWGFNKSCLGW